MESARRKIAETDAETLVAQAEIVKTEGQIQEAKSCPPADLGRTRDQARTSTAQSG